MIPESVRTGTVTGSARDCDCYARPRQQQQQQQRRSWCSASHRPSSSSDAVETRRDIISSLHHQQHRMTGTRLLAPAAGWLIVLLLASCCDAKVSDKRLCYDKDCKEVVSTGKTTIPYHSKDRDVLSFPGNTDVKVFSKEEGKRQDLWGVEINGKRGYAPKKFIREYKIKHNKLEHVVPTEDFYNQQVENVHKTEKVVESHNDSISGITQEDQKQTNVSDDSLNKSVEETLDPHQVSPSYDSIYDGTVLPQEIDDVEPPPPSYSTQTLQDNVKADEQVRLNVYPNILSSTFSALSGILSNGEETSEEESAEVVSSEKVVSEETTEKTPEIEKADESSLSSEETESAAPEDVAPENKNEDIAKEEFLQSKVDENVSDNEAVPLIQPQEKEIINNGETDSSTQSEVNEVVSGNKINEQDKVAENNDENVVPETNDVNTDEKTENNVETINSVDAVNSESIVNESSSVDVSNDDISKSDVVEEVKPASENFQNDIVPKQEEIVSVTTSADSTVNDTGASAPVEETILDKEEVDVNDTSVNSANVENSITPEVPLKQEAEKESVTAPNEPFLPYEKTIQSNLSENESLPSMPIESSPEIIQNVTTPDVFVEESNLLDNTANFEKQQEVNDNIVVSSNNVIDDSSYTTSVPTYLHNDSAVETTESGFQSMDSSQEHIVDIPSTPNLGEFLGNRNLLNAGKGFQYDDYSEEIGVDKVVIDESIQTTTSSGSDENVSSEVKQEEEHISFEDVPPASNIEKIVLPPETCDKTYGCSSDHARHQYSADENAVTNARRMADSSETLLYVCITAVTTLLFSLGYYFIENRRRDAYLIGKINNLEKDLMITRKECIMLDENFKSTKTKLDSIEDESFGSNEMVLSLRAELAASENTRVELEDQIASLEKELESTSEAGLELERMLREILSSHSEENNPLAQSIEDLQDRLNDQQDANESLAITLTHKIRENETLTGDLTVSMKKVEQLQAEVTKLAEELKTQTSTKINLEQTLSDQIGRLELQLATITENKSHLRKQLKLKELEVIELIKVVEQLNSNSLDFEKLYEVSQIKAEAKHLLEERDELKIKLSEEEGAHQLLEEHVKLVREEVAFLSEQCKAAEKEKKDAETRLEVLTKFFEDKEAQRQKEEAIWLEKQGEVSSTVERIQTMQNEILNYKKQIEMLKLEVLDTEREYKNQISVLETKAHEHWVAARQNERRLEEVKAESSQLRNRLTLVEKNINDGDPEVKLHRGLHHHLQLSGGPGAANGETPLTSSNAAAAAAANAHALFVGGSLHSSGESLDKSHHGGKA